MAALKPVQPSVCTLPKVWKEMCESATKPPSKEAQNRVARLAEKFSKVIKK